MQRTQVQLKLKLRHNYKPSTDFFYFRYCRTQCRVGLFYRNLWFMKQLRWYAVSLSRPQSWFFSQFPTGHSLFTSLHARHSLQDVFAIHYRTYIHSLPFTVCQFTNNPTTARVLQWWHQSTRWYVTSPFMNDFYLLFSGSVATGAHLSCTWLCNAFDSPN